MPNPNQPANSQQNNPPSGTPRRAPETSTGMEPPTPLNPNGSAAGFSFTQVANHLNVTPDTLRRLTRRFDRHLSDGIYAAEPLFSPADVAALVTVQQLLNQGYDDEQIHQHLTPAPAGDADSQETAALATSEPYNTHLGTIPAPGLPKAINDVLDTLVNGQKAVLNSQASVRDMLGVMAQDNFNLKEENRKLRERMLELERAHGEFMRRDEARRERQENRLRALEATVGALQQQVAQIVQAFRRPAKRRGWFG